jgi:hypothetical protein
VADAFRTAWEAVYRYFFLPIGRAFVELPGAIGRALSGVFSAIISPFKAAWDWIYANVIRPLKSAWNAVAGAVNSVHISVRVPDWIPGIGGKGWDWSPPHMPTLARGGLITRTGLVLAHAGEAITPLPARARGEGPVVRIEHAHFSERVDVDVFAKRLAWSVKTEGL